MLYAFSILIFTFAFILGLQNKWPFVNALLELWSLKVPLVQASVTVLPCFHSGNQKYYSINYMQKANLAYLTAFVQQ